MIRRSKRSGVRLVVLAWCFAHSAMATVVRLDDLEARAMKARPAIGAGRARLAAARADVDAAQSAYLPKLGFTMEAAASPGGHLIHVLNSSGEDYLVSGSKPVGDPGAFLPELRYRGSLSLTSRVYDFGRTRAALGAAHASGETAAAQARADRANVRAEVRNAYLDWLGADLLHAAAERALTSARARLGLVQARVENGTSPESELSPARYDEKTAELDECTSRQRMKDARLAVERAVGARLGKDDAPDPALLDTRPPGRPPGESPETAVLERKEASARALASLHDHETSPVLSAAAEAGIQGQMQNVFPTYRAAVSLTVPFWDGGAAAARASQSRNEALALDAEEREQRLSIDKAREQAAGDWVSGVERVRIAESLYAAASARARDTEETYALGQGRLDLVLAADASTAQAEREVVLARLARADAALRLLDPDAGVTTAGQ